MTAQNIVPNLSNKISKKSKTKNTANVFYTLWHNKKKT